MAISGDDGCWCRGVDAGVGVGVIGGDCWCAVVIMVVVVVWQWWLGGINISVMSEVGEQ